MVTDKLLPASFDGVQFLEIESENERGGIKHAVHEYPFSNRRSVENLGVNLPIFEINCLFSGDDWQQRRDAFRIAITSGRSAILVSQFKGKFQAKATDYSLVESAKKIGQALFKVTFVTESQAETISPTSTGETARGVEQATEELEEAANEDFAESFLEPVNQSGVDSLISSLNDFSDQIFEASTVFNDQIDKIQEISNAVQKFDDSLSALISAPLKLASEVTGLIKQVNNLAGDNKKKIEQLSGITNYGNLSSDISDLNDSDFKSSFSSPKIEKNNNIAISVLVRTFSIGLSYSAASNVPFDTTNELDDTVSNLDDSIVSVEDSIGAEISIPTFKKTDGLGFPSNVSRPGLKPSVDSILVDVRNKSISILDEARDGLFSTIEVSTKKIGIRKLVYLYTGSDETVDSVIKINKLRTPIVEGDLTLLVRSRNANIA